MKTIRLLYPDYVSGGLDTYYFGANLLAQILPPNDHQPLFRVPIEAPGKTYETEDGIYARKQVMEGIASAKEILKQQKPSQVITIGGNCLVSLAPFDYLHALYPNCGIIWIDSHPDVSKPENGYPYAHAMVLGALLGNGDEALQSLVENGKFEPNQILYVGLQSLHDYQQKFLEDLKVLFAIQDQKFVQDREIEEFISRFDHILVHLDIDVLDPAIFHSTYFANPELTGDGSGAGRMSMEELSDVLQLISRTGKIKGFSITEYLPFDEYRLHQMLKKIPFFTK